MPTLGKALSVEECRNGGKWAASRQSGFGSFPKKTDNPVAIQIAAPCPIHIAFKDKPTS